MPKHALIIGGTGMLKGVTKYILKEYDIVSVVARNDKGFKELESEAGKLSQKMNRLQVDYADYHNLTNALIKATRDFGDISLCVSWIHSTAKAAPLITAKVLNHSINKCDFYELLGSADADPDKEITNRANAFNVFENLIYHKIILGFVKEKETTRWLSNNEISAGVLKAIEENLSESIIGDVEPWNKKP